MYMIIGKTGGDVQKLSVADSTLLALNQFRNSDDTKNIKTVAISQRIKEAMLENNANEYFAMKIVEIINTVISNAEYYSLSAMQMRYDTKKMAESFSEEIRQVLRRTKLEDIIEILDKEEDRILSKINKTLQEQLEYDKKKKLKESTLLVEDAGTNYSGYGSLRDKIKYPVSNERKEDNDVKKQGSKAEQDQNIKPLDTDYIID